MTETLTLSPVVRHKELLATQRASPLRHPYAAFPLRDETRIAKKLNYPRAGVRLMQDGKWLMQLWYTPILVRKDKKEKTYGSRVAAFKAGQQQIHAARSPKHPAGQIQLHKALAVLTGGTH